MSNLEIAFYSFCVFILICYAGVFIVPLISVLKESKEEPSQE